MMYRALLIVLFISSFGYSQEMDTTLVRLQEKLKQSVSDSSKVESLLALGKHQFGRDNHSAERYFLETIDFIENGSYESNYQLAIAYRVLGAVERRKGNYKKTYAHYYKSLKLSSDPAHVATVHHNLGTAKSIQKNYSEALVELRKAITIWEGLGEYADAGGSYQEMGGIYRHIKQMDSARIYYDKALELFTKGYKKDTIKYINKYFGIQNSLGSILLKEKKYDSALSNFEKARVHFSKAGGDKSRLLIVNQNISDVYYCLGDYKKSMFYENEALEIGVSEGIKQRIATSFKRRSRLYKKMENPKDALKDYVLYKKYSDSLINTETIKKIQEQELNYEFEQEKLKDSLQFSQEKREVQLLADNESSKKNIYFILLIITVLLSAVIAFLVKRDFKYKKRLLELENKELLNENEKISRAFEKLKSSTNAEERIKAKQEILKLKILTEDDWNHFRNKFEILSPNFLPLLKKSEFKFTKSEERYLILKKLNVETKGIAGMIGVSNDSVLKTQYRLRKKLVISKTIDIISFVEQHNES